MRWILLFSACCVGLLAFICLVLWGVNGWTMPALSAHGWIALVLGTLFSSGLAILLMALVFHSDRSGTDADVSDAGRGRRDDVNGR